ncbi:MAG: LytTR family DNA-binding domain-containing protein [Thermodesulfobacteriota bacterium]
MITTFVVDDEPLARRKLVELIAEVGWAANVGEAASGAEAIERIDALRPDVVFLDVAMPEVSGLEVVQRLTATPVVVFTTAYDQHAVTAFELEAVDYVVKPFGRRRFLAAIERARRTVESRASASALARARAALDAARPGAPPLDRVLVRGDRGVIVPLALADVVRLEAQDDYVCIHAPGRSYLIGVRLADLESRLPSPPFLRVHRSHIVNLQHVERLVPFDGSRLQVQLKDGTRIVASRTRSHAIRDVAW